MIVDDTWLRQILWREEAHFYLSGIVSTYNGHIWSETSF